MKYMLLFIGDQEAFATMSPDESGPLMQQIGEWWGKHAAAGTIVGGEQLQPPSTATTVRHGAGEPVITDGPYIEAKEMIGGYALVDVPDLDGALDLAKTWPAKGTVEVRPLVTDPGEHEH